MNTNREYTAAERKQKGEALRKLYDETLPEAWQDFVTASISEIDPDLGKVHAGWPYLSRWDKLKIQIILCNGLPTLRAKIEYLAHIVWMEWKDSAPIVVIVAQFLVIVWLLVH